MVSIAAQYGYLWSSLWLHADNGALRELRKDPNVLLPGDVVELPPKGDKAASVSTESRHKFRRKAIPAKLRLQLKVGGQILANEKYQLNIDGISTDGNADGDGMVETDVPADAKSGEIRIGGVDGFVLPLEFGQIDPLDEATGVSHRLHDLGYYVGDDETGLNDAVQRFQRDHDLTPTGEVDAGTKSRLAEEFGQ